MPLVPGQTAEVQRVVTPDLTADVLGNAGVTVFATPFVVTLIENAARNRLHAEFDSVATPD